LPVKQAQQALLKKAPPATAVGVQGAGAPLPGISVGQLSPDQRQLVKSTLKSVLGPYREEDRAEVIEILKRSGGLDALHMAFYQEDDLDDDRVWDIWRIEGPAFVCHFRGAPHVHAYINVGVPARSS
jgi:hypothetical protein